tara:strand:- start:603 stop:1049 length:447 start_codon:yes stop_codon:yes gene_type:complete
MKRILIIFVFFLSSCGYQPLYLNNNIGDLKFKEMELTGSKKINRRIISLMNIEIDKEKSRYDKINIKSSKQILETSRNSKGQPQFFKMILNVTFSFKNKDEIMKEQSVTKEFSYKNLDNKFDLNEREIEIENNLLNEIIDEFFIYLSI